MIRVELISYTPEPELTIALAARTCYADLNYRTIKDELSQTDIERILNTVIVKGHHSVLEHASFTFSISGVSRVFTHQLVRHRIASYSQLSQQRVDSLKLDFILPPAIKDNNDLTHEYIQLMNQCQDLYRKMIQQGISKGSARYILPSAFTTRIVATFNARSLFNLFSQRECQVEEWEFRKVALSMHAQLMEISPLIFQYSGPPCQSKGICPEGKEMLRCEGYLGIDFKEKIANSFDNNEFTKKVRL
jgi:thymidylate synthase (FAD)